MHWFRWLRKKNGDQKQLDTLIPPEKRGSISCCYQEDIAYLKRVFQDDDPIEFREMNTGADGDIRVCLIFCDGMVDSAIIDNHLIRPLTQLKEIPQGEPLADAFLSKVFQVNSVKKAQDYNEIIQGVAYGDTLLLIDGVSEALLFSTKNFISRAVTEPEGEKILSGPREGFTEIMMSNLPLVRRRLRTEKLKMRYYTLGKQTNTQLCIAYLDGIVNEDILGELYRRLGTIDIDGVLDANYITEMVRDNPWSPFRSIGYTERPDVVAAKLLEGRIALFVDGTPVVLTLPYLFIENFQSSEDYYLNFYYTSFSRFLRILGFFMTVLVPATYIAITAYHQEMLPAPILISIAIERQRVPLPAALECFLLLMVFDILRETGLRMPTNVGQMLGIVGALVVGQAAVEAGLVAAPMIIVVALAGITSLLIPKMNAPVIYVRLGMLALGTSLGFLGVTLGCALLLAHVLSLQSFGISQLASGRKLKYQEIKDTIIRAPWWQMRLRPFQLSPNRVRAKSQKGEPS